ncbi:RING finger protein 145-like [Lineus longissimus]|uniref:RING finger protein 145-like n=1 Tax=Lineus longissimus TaxID=88925 RepID=UPI002B4D3D38
MPRITKDHIMLCAHVILRVPALFLMDCWYKTNPEAILERYGIGMGHIRDAEMILSSLYYAVILIAVALMFLPMDMLFQLYLHILCGGLLLLAHFTAFKYVEEEKAEENLHSSVFDDNGSMYRLGMHLVIQVILSSVVAYLMQIKDWTRFMLLMYTLPMIARAINFPVTELHVVHNFSAIFTMLMTLMVVFNHVGTTIDTVKTGLNNAHAMVQNIGWLHFFFTLVDWFHIPPQFFVFWVMTFLAELYKFTFVKNYQDGVVIILLATVGECCSTPISLIGLCITVSYTSWFILTLTKLYLKGWEGMNLEREQTGWTEGFTMLLLGVQTDIMELKAATRAFLMSIVLFIVVLSLIQSMYELTDPVLLSLSASHSRNVVRHIKTVLLATFLWMFPLLMTWAICQFFDLDFWLLVIISSCLLTSMQVFGSLVVYSLFIYDSLLTEPWENLDDVVYYARAVTRVLEFVVAVFVVLYGAKESVYGEWSWINSSILIIHFYFNVWQRLQTGWKSFLLRRKAVQKIESLPLASPEQLEECNDLCAICFQEMTCAHITPCKHFFHGICLRKWLYVQDTCPICHQVINFPNDVSEDESADVPDAGIRNDVVPPPANEAEDNHAGNADEDGLENRFLIENNDSDEWEDVDEEEIIGYEGGDSHSDYESTDSLSDFEQNPSERKADLESDQVRPKVDGAGDNEANL